MKVHAIIIVLFLTVHASFAQEGQIIEQNLVHDDSLRSYLLYVPAAYDGSVPWPLVVNLHGADSSPEVQVWLSGMNAIADTARFLVAYPRGIINGEGIPGWNDGLKPEFLDDVGFVESVILQITRQYSVDDTGIYATGMSNGSGMSLTLGCRLSSYIAAIGMIAAQGIIEQEDCIADRPVPVLYMHGTADIVVPFDGGTGIFGAPEFIPSRDLVQFWVDKNGCQGDPDLIEFEDINTTDSSTVALEHYANCEAMSEVSFYVIEEGGHTWPGGPPVPPGLEFLGNVNLDINASLEIWNFFSRHRHPNPMLPTGVAIVDVPLSPDGIALQQNYPNPFNSSTRIRYTVDQGGQVKLTIYDLLGREVEVAVQEFRSSGEHEITLNASSLTEGVYLYSLEVNGQRLARKFTVIK